MRSRKKCQPITLSQASFSWFDEEWKKHHTNCNSNTVVERDTSCSQMKKSGNSTGRKGV